MSLKELLEINEIVFGVSKPRIKVCNFLSGSPSANSGNYMLGTVIEANPENKFLYFGKGQHVLGVFVKYKNPNVLYVKLNVIVDSYTNGIDLIRIIKSSYSGVLGISIYRVMPLFYTTSNTTINIKDLDADKNVYSFSYPTPQLQVNNCITRFYLIDYDNSKLLAF